jgi:predicted lactoylglutathione lyase
MTKEFWVNLPVKDISRTKDFYTKLGFTFKPLPGNRNDGAMLILGIKNVQVLFFEEEAFKSFSGQAVADPHKGNEVLFSIDAETTEEVNLLSGNAKKAGGNVFAEPGEKDGWMYGCGFADPDGHRWSVVFMDESKQPREKQEMQVP